MPTPFATPIARPRRGRAGRRTATCRYCGDDVPFFGDLCPPCETADDELGDDR